MATSDTSIAQHPRNVELFHRLIQSAFGAGDVTVVDELFAPNFVEHQAGVQPPTAQGVKQLITYLHQALPDLTYTIEDMAATNDKVWARLHARGTHNGMFMGLPPTGKAVAIDVIDICRFADGKIVEHWGVADGLAALAQIGRGPQPTQSPE